MSHKLLESEINLSYEQGISYSSTVELPPFSSEAAKLLSEAGG